MPAIATKTKTPTLTSIQIEDFHRDGFLGPFRAYEPGEMAEVRSEIEAILESDPPDHKQNHHNRHLDSRLIYDVSTHPAVLERMKAIMGNDLMMWRTNFFIKHPGAKAIPWHQDTNYWPIEPAVVISAWMAIDEATLENSCPQVIPGSHRKLIPHVKASDEVQFHEQADSEFFDASKAVPLEMKPGEFFLFNERTLHFSAPNTSQKRRIGLAIRVVLPCVRVLSYDAPKHGLVTISGRDDLKFSRHAPRP